MCSPSVAVGAAAVGTVVAAAAAEAPLERIAELVLDRRRTAHCLRCGSSGRGRFGARLYAPMMVCSAYPVHNAHSGCSRIAAVEVLLRLASRFESMRTERNQDDTGPAIASRGSTTARSLYRSRMYVGARIDAVARECMLCGLRGGLGR